ncbi:hypothetical protein FGLOB1_14057 [Fusarium globosum]|uniref:Uncharacterized protein n=1 Tax=Fusarium globosum TaxID=78864 RepID=A0A8H5XKA6_9HYPO|nr:hypothetical protein FGLOB1_14057 [Fusarium globosum]
MSSQHQDIALNPTGWGYATGQNSRARRSLIRYKKSSLPQGEDFEAEVTSVQEPPALDLTDTEKETDGATPSQLGVLVGLLLPLHYKTPKDINLVGTFDAETGHVVPYQAGCLLVIRPLWRNKGEFHVLYKNDEHQPLRLSMRLPRQWADSHMVYYDEWATSLRGPLKNEQVKICDRVNVSEDEDEDEQESSISDDSIQTAGGNAGGSGGEGLPANAVSQGSQQDRSIAVGNDSSRVKEEPANGSDRDIDLVPNRVNREQNIISGTRQTANLIPTSSMSPVAPCLISLTFIGDLALPSIARNSAQNNVPRVSQNGSSSSSAGNGTSSTRTRQTALLATHSPIVPPPNRPSNGTGSSRQTAALAGPSQVAPSTVSQEVKVDPDSPFDYQFPKVSAEQLKKVIHKLFDHPHMFTIHDCQRASAGCMEHWKLSQPDRTPSFASPIFFERIAGGLRRGALKGRDTDQRTIQHRILVHLAMRWKSDNLPANVQAMEKDIGEAFDLARLAVLLDSRQ